MRISVRHIQDAVAADFEVHPALFFSKCRATVVSHPRQVAMYLARKVSGHSLPTLARIFKLDHTTVLYSIRAVEKRMEIDRALALKIEARKLLLESEPQCEAKPLLGRVIQQIPDPATQKTLIMDKWARGEISPYSASRLIRELRLEAA